MQTSNTVERRVYIYTVYTGLSNGNLAKGQNITLSMSWLNPDASIHTKIDINNDSKLDIAVGDAWGTLNFLFNEGNGNFQSNVVKSFMPVGHFLYSTDINKDGKSDLVTTGKYFAYNNGIQVALNKGNSEFSTPVVAMTKVYPKIGDFNSDGNLDILGIERGTSSYPPTTTITHAYLKPGQGNGVFSPTITYTFTHHENSIGPSIGYNFQISDINQDGKPDVMINNPWMFTTS
jgi:hypothetical protein